MTKQINQYTMKAYTPGEIEFIKNNKGNLSNKKIAEKLGRGIGTIKDKIKNMGFSRKPEEVKKIIKDSSINRKYIKYAQNKTWRKFVTINGKRILESHYIWSKHNNKQIPKGHVIHHKDLNPKNDKIENLELMTKANHNKIHTSNKGIYGQIKKGKEAL